MIKSLSLSNFLDISSLSIVYYLLSIILNGDKGTNNDLYMQIKVY